MKKAKILSIISITALMLTAASPAFSGDNGGSTILSIVPAKVSPILPVSPILAIVPTKPIVGGATTTVSTNTPPVQPPLITTTPGTNTLVVVSTGTGQTVSK